MELREHIDSLVPRLAGLKADPTATPFYEAMSDGLIWTDEKIHDLSEAELGCLRCIFRVRTSMPMETPDLRFEVLWAEVLKKCPQWIGFTPSRIAPSETLKALYAQSKKRWNRQLTS
jgi:hypothetical protein